MIKQITIKENNIINFFEKSFEKRELSKDTVIQNEDKTFQAFFIKDSIEPIEIWIKDKFYYSLERSIKSKDNFSETEIKEITLNSKDLKTTAQIFECFGTPKIFPFQLYKNCYLNEFIPRFVNKQFKDKNLNNTEKFCLALINKNPFTFSSLEEACQFLSKVDYGTFNNMLYFPNGHISKVKDTFITNGHISKVEDTFLINFETSLYSFKEKIELFKIVYNHLDNFQIFDFECFVNQISVKDNLIKSEYMPNILKELGKKIVVTKRLNKNDFKTLKKLSIDLNKEINYNVLFENVSFVINNNVLEIKNNSNNINFDFLNKTFKNIKIS